MRIGILGAGRIGGNIAGRLVDAGHTVTVGFTRRPDHLTGVASDLGAVAASPTEVAGCEVVVLSVPWGVLDDALAAAGSLAGRIVIDTTNQFGPDGVIDLGGQTAARHNADRIAGARYTKSFNTLTAAFQADAAGRSGDGKVVQWLCGDDEGAKAVVAGLITDAGYVPVDVGGVDDCAVMEPPRRSGAVYGEEYRASDGRDVVEARRGGRPIPATPRY